MKKVVLFLGLFLLGVLFVNAQLVNGGFEDEFGNFSTLGWENMGGLPAEDNPEICGPWALGLYGGCVWTSCQQAIPAIQEGQVWKLSCWAKVEDTWSGGELTFFPYHAGTFIQDPVWTYYEVIDTFTNLGNDTISVFLGGGGGFAGGIGALFDCVELEYLGSIMSTPDQNQTINNEPVFYISYSDNNNPEIHIRIPTQAQITISIFDSFGRKMGTPVNEEFAHGKFSKQIHLQKYPTGIYFLEVYIDGNQRYIFKKKIVKGC